MTATIKKIIKNGNENEFPSYGLATQSDDGLMSSTDKTKLDGLGGNVMDSLIRWASNNPLSTQTINYGTDRGQLNIPEGATLIQFHHPIASYQSGKGISTLVGTFNINHLKSYYQPLGIGTYGNGIMIFKSGNNLIVDNRYATFGNNSGGPLYVKYY